MKPLYKAHGKHCYLRSFQTSCSRCGADVLYWECKHGSKIFFQYPPYGKLIQHRCPRYKGKQQVNKFPVVVKTPTKLFEDISISCPDCGKLFKKEEDLNKHLDQLKKNDLSHNNFINNNLSFENPNQEEHQERSKLYKPRFGTINLKQRNK